MMNTTIKSLRSAKLLALALIATSSAQAQEGRSEQIERTRTSLEQWVEAKRAISKIREDWKLGREVLVGRAELMEREIETIREKIAEANTSVADAEKKRSELAEQSEAKKRSTEALTATVIKLEDRTRRLVQRLPGMAAERVKMFSQRLPVEGAETKASLSERYQNVVVLLNELNKIQGEITMVPEVREVAPGQSAEVATIYVGLGRGYYATNNGQLAGIGAANETAWTWQSAPVHAGEISRMIAILKNEQVADFVRLPLNLPTQQGR